MSASRWYDGPDGPPADREPRRAVGPSIAPPTLTLASRLPDPPRPHEGRPRPPGPWRRPPYVVERLTRCQRCLGRGRYRAWTGATVDPCPVCAGTGKVAPVARVRRAS